MEVQSESLESVRLTLYRDGCYTVPTDLDIHQNWLSNRVNPVSDHLL